MSPLQARLSFIGFLAIAGAISANALYLQEAPLAPKAEVTKFPPKQTEVEPETPLITKAIPPDEQTRDETRSTVDESVKLPDNSVTAIQRELKSLGYEPGTVDGAAGLLTRAAILAFEHDKGLTLTGEPSDELLVKLLVRPKNNPVKKSQPVTDSGKKIIRVVQSVLSDLGYATGDINGINNGQTQTAIREFEQDRKLKVTGRVSGHLIKELLSITDIPLGGG